MKTLNIIWIYAHLTGLYWADNIWPDPDPMTDGTHYTNHFITETSPDLLQHAHNPVEWYPWDPQALEKTRQGNHLTVTLACLFLARPVRYLTGRAPGRCQCNQTTDFALENE